MLNVIHITVCTLYFNKKDKKTFILQKLTAQERKCKQFCTLKSNR